MTEIDLRRTVDHWRARALDAERRLLNLRKYVKDKSGEAQHLADAYSESEDKLFWSGKDHAYQEIRDLIDDPPVEEETNN